VVTAADWIDRQLFDVSQLLPGLYSGRSGTAWSLFDAARLLDDTALAGRAADLLGQVPVDWPFPDVYHGTAGAGMAHLHLWQATGNDGLRQRIVQCADSVLAAAQQRDGQLLWTNPDLLGPALAGLANFGYAHGVAGAGTFLLYSALATGLPRYLTAARQAGATLAATADVADAAARWPSEGTAGRGRMHAHPHWCNGASGIGTFLIRLWWITGERQYCDLAEAAGETVYRHAWLSASGTCHGLSGDADFLLDLARFTGRRRYRDRAVEMAGMLHARHTVRGGLTLLPDDSRVRVSASYGAGLAGALSFLLRLRHGGDRWWMPDRLLPQHTPTHQEEENRSPATTSEQH